jgi:hypothetical protein
MADRSNTYPLTKAASIWPSRRLEPRTFEEIVTFSFDSTTSYQMYILFSVPREPGVNYHALHFRSMKKSNASRARLSAARLYGESVNQYQVRPRKSLV